MERIEESVRFSDRFVSIPKYHAAVVMRAKEFMEDRFTDNITVEEVSSHCEMSPYHFSRIFKRLTSYSPYQYLLNLRLYHAQQLLMHTNRQVTDICFSTGFNSIEHFATIFRAKFNVNPTDYRKTAVVIAHPIFYQHGRLCADRKWDGLEF